MSVETNSILIREEDRAVLVGGVTVAVFGALLVLSLAAEDEVRAGLRDLIWVILIVLALGGFLIFLHYRMTLTFTRDGVIYQGLFKRKILICTKVVEERVAVLIQGYNDRVLERGQIRKSPGVD